MVRNASELNAALANPQVKSVKLFNDISGTTFTANRLVDIDLNNMTLTGNVNINTTQAGTININAGTITGNLTVNAPNATVNNTASVGGTITITDVAVGTWNENVNGNSFVINDKTGVIFNVAPNKTVTKIEVTAAATGDVKINNEGIISELEAKSSVDLDNKPGATVSKVSGTATVDITGNAEGVENIENPATEASEANKAVAKAEIAVKAATFSKLDLEGGKKSKEDALKTAVEEIVGERITVSVSNNVVTLSKQAADSVNVTIANASYDKDIHISQATFKEYKSGEVVIGQTIVLGIDKTRSIDKLPEGTKVSVFAADGDKMGVGLGVNTLKLETDISRGDQATAWGFTTTLLYSGSTQGQFSWDSTVWSAFTQDKKAPAYVKVEYTVNGTTFTKITPLSAQ